MDDGSNPSPEGMPAKVVIDCDPGHDDAMAIILAARHAEVLGLTTVAGNIGLDLTTRNALITTQILGVDLPVRRGANRPLVEPPRVAAHVHGPSGLDGPTLPDLDRSETDDDAVDWLAETARDNPGIWLIPMGPLTNVALAIRRHPDMVGHLRGVSMMGGGTADRPGNTTPMAEFNIAVDPEAAAILFEQEVSIRMCGLNLTHQLVATDVEAGDFRALGTATGVFVADLLDHYITSYERSYGSRRAAIHDPCAVLAVTHPELFEFERRQVRVELSGAHTRGMTVVDRRQSAPGEGPVEVAMSIDADRAMELLIDACAPPAL